MCLCILCISLPADLGMIFFPPQPNISSHLKALSISKAKIALSPVHLSSYKLHLQRFLQAALFLNSASTATTSDGNSRRQTLGCFVLLKKRNRRGLMKVQYNRFKLDCLWKGAIQQTETKQSKSILLSSCCLYVQVVGREKKDRGSLKGSMKKVYLERETLQVEVTRSHLCLSAVLPFTAFLLVPWFVHSLTALHLSPAPSSLALL